MYNGFKNLSATYYILDTIFITKCSIYEEKFNKISFLGTAGANNSSPLHLQTGSSSGIPGSAASSGSGSSMNSELTTLQTQSFQFSPGGSAASSTIYQWPQNGYYPASDWTASTSTIYTSGTTIPGAPLMAVVTPLPHAQVEDVPTAILTSTATSMPLNR